jgi:hypothetical protein
VDLDRQFLDAWRDGLMARAWDELAQQQRELHDVLRFRAKHQDMCSSEMAKS